MREKIRQIEVDRLRKGYIVETLTSVDFQEIDKLGGKVKKIYEGVIRKKIFTHHFSEFFFQELFDLRRK